MPEFNKIFFPIKNKIFIQNSIENIKDKLNEFKKNIDYELNVEIICVLREQASYIESFYLQQVKTNYIKEDFNEFKKKINLDTFYYSKFINNLQKYFKVHYLWYETILINKTKTSFKPLFDIIGLGNNFNDIPYKTSISNINIETSTIDKFLKINEYNKKLRSGMYG